MKKYFIKDDGTIKLTNMLVLIGILFFYRDDFCLS